jgi:hypothetical protein
MEQVSPSSGAEATPDRNGSGFERKQSVRGPLYFPNAFFSSGSISPLAAMGSKISVSP